MQATKRYALLSALLLLAILFRGRKWLLPISINEVISVPKRSTSEKRSWKDNGIVETNALYNLPSFTEREYYEDMDSIDRSPIKKRDARERVYKNKKCRMESCFDIELCYRRGFKIFVYPNYGKKVSDNYDSILSVIRTSRYYSSDPEKACLFVLSYDTLDRDHLSKDYVRNLDGKISRLKYWNNGRNHVVFNLYSGTWPDYLEDLGFDIGNAILAKASFGDTNYRIGFDVAFPLFSKTHPTFQGPGGLLKANSFPPQRQYLLTFKGKRYTYGIGSNTRNALHHIHNAEDIIILTTCKHGNDWKRFMDANCEADNEEYDKWDYQQLLHNSTFCLVPRGRRLGSFRFLESLQAACIPVVLANGWMLPFDDVIDWSIASLTWEERLLLQVPGTLRNIDDETIMTYRHKSQFLWEKYFSSVDLIVKTSFEIIHDRIFPEKSRPAFIWNEEPGGLYYLPSYSTSPHDYPFYYGYLGIEPSMEFTALIQAISPFTSSSSPLMKLVRNLLKSDSCSQIVIVWHCGKAPPAPSRWHTMALESGKEIVVIDDHPKLMGRRFHPFAEIRNNAVLSLDGDAVLNVQELDFAFQVWRSFPDRIVGFPASHHYWNEKDQRWLYTSELSNRYSMVLTGAAFIHRYYFALYTEWLPANLRDLIDQTSNCEDILMNMLVSHVTRRPPIKVIQKKRYKETPAYQDAGFSLPPGGVILEWSSSKHSAQRQICMTEFVEWFGYMPLLFSEARLDPALYKDNVSKARKRYPKIEI